MGGHAVSTAVLIGRKRAEIDVVMLQHTQLKREADRGTYSARNARERLHREWDALYDEWCLLRLRADIEAMDEAS